MSKSIWYSLITIASLRRTYGTERTAIAGRCMRDYRPPEAIEMYRQCAAMEANP